MKIDVHGYNLFYSGRDHKHFDITISENGFKFEETMKADEAEQIARDLFVDVVLDDVYHYEVIDKLIELGIIEKDQVVRYIEDLEE